MIRRFDHLLGEPSLRSLRDIDRLVEILAVLRTPGTGCPWDLLQTHASLAPYVLEEAYELVDAIERKDVGDLRDELGDCLLQVIFHARLAEEAGSFDFGDVVEAIAAKMLRRHPHVFPSGGRPTADDGPAQGPLAGTGGGGGAASPDGSIRAPGVEGTDWNAIKAQERRLRGVAVHGLLSEIPVALPALTRSVKLQARASTVGFDWNDARLVLAKIREEVDEVEDELSAQTGDGALQDEIGDLFFALSNLARHVGVDPEAAVRSANRKFERRFAFIERELAARGSSPDQATLADMEALWVQAKRCRIERQPDRPGEGET